MDIESTNEPTPITDEVKISQSEQALLHGPVVWIVEGLSIPAERSVSFITAAEHCDPRQTSDPRPSKLNYSHSNLAHLRM